MGWTLQGPKVVGSGPEVRAEIDASAHHFTDWNHSTISTRQKYNYWASVTGCTDGRTTSNTSLWMSRGIVNHQQHITNSNEKSGIFATWRPSASIFINDVVHKFSDGCEFTAASWSSVRLLRSHHLYCRLDLCTKLLHLDTSLTELHKSIYIANYFHRSLISCSYVHFLLGTIKY